MIFNFIAYLLGYGLIIVISLFLLVGLIFAIIYLIIVAIDWCITTFKTHRPPCNKIKQTKDVK